MRMAPVTVNSAKPSFADCMTATLATDIWLVVRVPVLSEQITVVQPKVSTEGKLPQHTTSHLYHASTAQLMTRCLTNTYDLYQGHPSQTP
jgi:hypothetical protein